MQINNFIPHPIVQNGDFATFTTPQPIDHYTISYDESQAFDSQTGVYNIEGKQTIIPVCEEFHQQTPTVIDGYSCTTSFTPSDDCFNICIDNAISTSKPYLKNKQWNTSSFSEKMVLFLFFY